MGDTRGDARVKVVSIVGPGRSGSTILGSILGQADGFFCVGEIRWLWTRGLQDGRRCGCGEPLPSCPFWRKVLDGLGGADLGRLQGEDGEDPGLRPDQVAAWQDELAPLRRRNTVLRSADGRRSSWDALTRYGELAERLYLSVADVSGSRVVVDTSKRAHDAAVVARMESVDHYVVHLVRDPRAVAYSWGRVKPAPQGATTPTLTQRRPLPSVARWVENTAGAELLRRHVREDRWLALRYEDFVGAPRATVGRILRFVGEPEVSSPMSGERSVVLKPTHTVGGNPNRFRTGVVSIVEDDEWRRRLPRGVGLEIGMLALPFLARYRYGLRWRDTHSSAGEPRDS